MGRAPCCDKANVKKGPWSPEEDAKLKSYIEQHGTGGNWIALPQKIGNSCGSRHSLRTRGVEPRKYPPLRGGGLKRCGKSCRLRWLNYLRPNIKHGGFSEEEDNIICSLYISIGSRWSIIAAQLPGRTDNDIKNYWNTRLKKKLLGKQRKEQARRGSSLKHEMKRGSGNSNISPDNNNQHPYWPELPVLAPIPYSSQEPRFNDHASIRKLLMKLGGRFSQADLPIHHGTSLQFTNDTFTTEQIYHSVNMATSTPIEALNSSGIQFSEVQSYPSGAELNMLQGQSSFPAELEEIMYNNPHGLDGLEFLCGDDMVGTTSGGSTVFGEVSSLVYTSVASNYVGVQQGTLEECAFEELRYPVAN